MTQSESTPTETPTMQHDVIEVIDTLADAMSGLWPTIPADKMRTFGLAISNVFELFTRIGASNILPFAAQVEVNRHDIETLREQMADQRTVVGDLLGSRTAIESQLTSDEARIAKLESRVDQLEQRVDRLVASRALREGDRGE